MGKVTVLYFAAATTALGLTFETFVLPGDGLKLSDLANLITSRHPNTGIERVLEQSRWSVDAELVDLSNFVVLRGGEEVAVIPPVSGG
jgi:molybdopterin converting factor small subunit